VVEYEHTSINEKHKMNPNQASPNTPTPTTTPQPQQSLPQTSQQLAQPLNSSPVSPHSSAGTIVLQWLTYAFWGWTVLIMSFLTVVVLNNMLGSSNDASFVAYVVAAILILLPISVVCDVIYSKQEPQHKTGAASIVMVIHAVLFALFGIGALIAAAISIVTLFLNSSDSTNSIVALISSAIIFVLYGATFLRTLNPARLPWMRRFFVIFMVLAVGIVAVLGIIGPAAKERSTRNDRLINDNLETVATSVSDYARKSNTLPSSLNDIVLTGDAKKLVDNNLVEYKPNTLPSTVNYNSSANTVYPVTFNNASRIYYYQLCVNYAKEHKDKYSSNFDNAGLDSSGYTTYISVGSYPAGQTCYKVKTSDY
jgi:hypothetical protein